MRNEKDMTHFTCADCCVGPAVVHGVKHREYEYGPDQIVFEDGSIYCDTGNGSMVYVGECLDVENWIFESEGKIVWDGSNHVLEKR